MTSRLILCSILAFLLSACAKQEFESIDSIDSQVLSIWGHSPDLYKKTPNRSLGMILNKKSKAICTGVFIHKEVLLTAAHCLQENPTGYSIAVGENPFLGDYFERKIVRWSKHPELDLAIARINKAIPGNWTPLDISSTPLDMGQNVFLIGYGVSEKGKAGALRSTSAQILHIEDPKIVISQSSKKGICFGDSGGPLLIQVESKWQIAAIAEAVLYPEDARMEERCQHSSTFTALLKEAHWIFSSTRQILDQK